MLLLATLGFRDRAACPSVLFFKLLKSALLAELLDEIEVQVAAEEFQCLCRTRHISQAHSKQAREVTTYPGSHGCSVVR